MSKLIDHLASLEGANLTKDADLTPEQFHALISHARALKDGVTSARIRRAKIALVFMKPSLRTRAAFESAAVDLGAAVTYFGPHDSHLGDTESVPDSARVLGAMYDLISFRGFAQQDVEALATHAGVPVCNALTDDWHPTQMLADFMTMDEHTPKLLADINVCYVGDARNNVAHSLVVSSALAGCHLRIAAPPQLQPSSSVLNQARSIAGQTGARLHIGDDPYKEVEGADFVYTDVWLSMGDEEGSWEEKLDLLMPYQVNDALLNASENENVRFLHCLPAIHDRSSLVGAQIIPHDGPVGLEVTDQVFRSSRSLVFEEATNRLHATRAVLDTLLG